MSYNQNWLPLPPFLPYQELNFCKSGLLQVRLFRFLEKRSSLFFGKFLVYSLSWQQGIFMFDSSGSDYAGGLRTFHD